jgi:hypothetical protein
MAEFVLDGRLTQRIMTESSKSGTTDVDAAFRL